MWTEKALVIASSNAGKVSEFKRLFLELGLTVTSQNELGIQTPKETGLSFVENSLLKARHASKLSGMPALADDSGLVVPALDGAPGLFSARYAGVKASAQENLKKLLLDMIGFVGIERQAHYVCALILVKYPEDPDPLVAIGTWHGRILEASRGQGGFGYDPIFLPSGQTLTAAELAPEVKNKISHRGTALTKLFGQMH
ncbi:RdgB/HAM1 family non-canonical purine NTP pyrophosphatase [Litorivicinus sp.]|nr:RdgB/HAM1 family non-canonical purine NTP pyrophosphatase [Litorivicinus sp.]